jgi:hypothetical protein
VFPAGRRKIVGVDAVVGWHGGTRQWPSAEAMCDVAEKVDTPTQLAECLESAHAARQREARLYSLFRVNPDIMIFGLGSGRNYPSRRTDVAWTYSPTDLARFGIRGFEIDGPEWSPMRKAIDGHTVCVMDVMNETCVNTEQSFR